MTLMKSLLLGSAAGIVAVASAQAADLPTRKGAPAVEYVKVCSITVAGKPIVGFVLPGSDTCMHFTGYITAQYEGGNLKDSEAVGTYNVPSGQFRGGTVGRPETGYTTRLNFGADVVSNTSYGPLYGHLEMQFENGNGFDNTGSGAYINLAYLTWAGITAGKAPSFYSFTGGGPGWANFFSPDQKGFNQPDLFAYTASFGGGFSATVAAQSDGQNCPGFTGGAFAGDINNHPGFGCSGGGTNNTDLGANYTYNGQRTPDFVAALNVTQGWGSAQISGVAHYVSVTGNIPVQQRVWGWGIDAGVSFNLPQFGAGDDIVSPGFYPALAGWSWVFRVVLWV
jgi:hypothetical protein